MTSDLDLRERRELCERFDELGPDAPTLCAGWTTADLASHLVIRERDLVAAPGILIAPLAGLTEKRMAATKAKHPYPELVELVRSGPPFGPMKIPQLRYLANIVEYFVHHEDVRRANGAGPRTDRPDLDDALWAVLARTAPLMVRKARVPGVRVRLVAPGGRERTAGGGEAEVTIVGAPGELVLELYGRRGAAQVTYDGADAAVAAVRAAEFGI